MPRIEYESLDFENAYIYSKCSVPLADQGLVLVRGLNLDDGGYLGAGKSSVFEVFAQLQMGKSGKRDQRKGESRSDIVNMFADEGMRASLKLRVNGHPFEIQQYREHSRYNNAVKVIDRRTGVDVLPRDATRAPHKFIRDELLRLDETSFFNLIYLVQELNNVMIHGAEYERRNRLTVMFDLHVYDELKQLAKRTLDMHDTAMSDFAEVRAELEEVKQKLADAPARHVLEGQLDEAREKLAELQEQHQQDATDYATLTDLAAKLERRGKLQKQVMDRFKESDLFQEFTHPKDVTQAHVDEYKSKLANTNAECVSAQHDFDQLKKRASLKAQLQRLSGRPLDEIQEDLTEVKSQLVYLNRNELSQAEEREALLGKMQDAPSFEGVDIDSVDLEHEEMIVKETNLKIRVRNLNSDLKDAVCPHCKRPFDMSPEEISEKEVDLQEAREELRVVTNRLNELKKTRKALSKHRRLLSQLSVIDTERSVDEVSADIRKLTRKEKKLASELEISQQRQKIEAILGGMPQGSVSEVDEKVKRLKRKVESLENLYETGKFVVDNLVELRDLPTDGNLSATTAEAARLKRRMNESSDEIVEASATATHLETRFEELRRLQRRKKTLVRTIDRQKSIIQEIDCLKALNKAFGSKGIKQDRFQAILSDAAQRTVPAYGDILWPNRNVALRLADEDSKSLQFQLERLDSHLRTKSSLLSGGERHKAGLAFLFGMRDLKEVYTGSSSNVLIVDEPFGNLDPLGTEGLIAIFQRLKQKFGSVFVISHRPEVLSHPVWDQTWWAIRENDNATLYLDDPPAHYQKLAAELVKQ